MLVQISETMKGKARQTTFGNLPSVGTALGAAVYSGASALKNKVVKAIDNKVKEAIGPVLQASSSNVPNIGK